MSRDHAAGGRFSPQYATERGRPRAWMPVTLAVVIGFGALAPMSPASARSAASCADDGLPSYAVARGDSWFDIAARAGVSRRSLYEANDASADSVLLAGSRICLPADAEGLSSCEFGAYEVRRNDSWSGLADAAGVSMRSLLQANDATTDRVLQPGMTLCLPEGADAPAGEASSSERTGSASSSNAYGMVARPIQGPCYFASTWGEPRSGGRTHEGVDFIADEGNYIYAVVDGTLTRRAWDIPGRLSGNAWWLTADDGTMFFYGHLLDFAPGLEVGDRVAAGEIIGFNGTTGSSSAPHLHFEIHPGGGGPVDPYPAVSAIGGCKTGDGYRQPNGWIP
jgi:murein DD-endopeptidase MepM/ murein hydrolase activator NlpD